MSTLTHAMASQVPFNPTGVPVHGMPQPVADPGPSSHPHGPPNLNQPNAVANAVVTAAQNAAAAEAEEDGDDEEKSPSIVQQSASPTTRQRGARNANMTSDEWARQRKDNHVSARRLLPPRRR